MFRADQGQENTPVVLEQMLDGYTLLDLQEVFCFPKALNGIHSSGVQTPRA